MTPGAPRMVVPSRPRLHVELSDGPTLRLPADRLKLVLTGLPGAPGADGVDGLQGLPGLPGEPGVVPDIALTETDLTTSVQDLFGGLVNLGTNGEVILRWQRSGRMIEGWLRMAFDEDAIFPSGGPFIIYGADLPFIPRTPPPVPAGFSGGYGEPGAFGYLVSNTLGRHEPIGSVIANIGGPALAFVLVQPHDLVFGFEGLWSPTNPAALAGQRALWQGRISYEADTEA